MKETDQTVEQEGFFAFRAEINKNIKRTIRSLRASGTVAMSSRNLLQVTPTPKSGGPIGTNAQWVYAQMFNEEIAKLSKPYRSFVYELDTDAIARRENGLTGFPLNKI